MYVYTFLPRGYHASYYYRIAVPLLTMQEAGLDITPLFDETMTNVPVHARAVALTHSDINLLYQPIGEGLQNNLKLMATWKQVPYEGRVLCPPMTIADTDDNLFDVSPLNGSFKEMGIRDLEGNPLEDGAEVSILDSDTNQRRVLWKDGVNGFDIARNKAMLDRYRSIARLCHAVTCSTPRIAEYTKKELGEDTRTFVFPNSIRFDHFPVFKGLDLARRNAKEIRVLYQGSTTHYEDLYPLRWALAQAMKKNRNIKLIVWGALYRWFTELLEPDQVEHIKWVSYDQYRLRLSTIAPDITICPLRPSRFNSGRSAIKFYEPSAVMTYATPATLAQRFGAYADEIEDGRTGMLFDGPADFMDKLLGLADDAALRQELGSNANDWVHQHRDAFKTVTPLFEFYSQCRKDQIAATPVMSEEEAIENRRLMAEARAAAEAEGNGELSDPVHSDAG